ncbi:MAG TPA: nitrate/nitrite transporter [Blastocatellia bacterium]|nr:nitrate/nitrite transporter [Blastocatellia bacterium]
METRETRQGHVPTLIASFLHFDVSFMLWVLLGALGVYIAKDLGLSPAQKGLMVATPILSGALMRVPLGLLSDRLGAKRVGVAMLVFLFLPLALGWRASDGLSAILAIGLMVGVAGASFAVALPLASRWYPAHRQGLVMGIAAAGNSGTVIANLLAPRLARVIGWHGVLGAAMIPLAIVLVAFLLMARDSDCGSVGAPVRLYVAALKQRQMLWFCLFYCVTFGGYVGLSGFLPIFFRDQYGVKPETAGYLTALAALAGSGVRPLGGYLADKFGGARMLSVLFVCIAIAYALASTTPAIAVMTGIIVFGMSSLGMGNGAVFQMVPQQFPREIGIATGVVGAVGGLGGFILPNLLGSIRQVTGSFTLAFVVLSAFGLGALALLRFVSNAENGSVSAVAAMGALIEPEDQLAPASELAG